MAPAKPDGDPASLFWRLTLNQHAINLSTTTQHDTFRLVATPRRQDGTPLEGLASPRFVSADSLRVVVSPDGLVKGVRAVNRARITVTLTQGNLTHSTEAFVSVTTSPTPPVVARLSLEPAPPDSAKATIFGSFYYPEPSLVTRVFDAQGTEIVGSQASNLAIWIEPSDPQLASYDNAGRRLSVLSPGRVAFYARTMAYGVELADTLEYTIGLPLNASIVPLKQVAAGATTPTYRFTPSTVTVGPGAYVWWYRAVGIPAFDITFEDPTNVAEDEILQCLPAPQPWCGRPGNIEPFGDTTGVFAVNRVSRYFPVPGTYRYHSAALNDSGVVVVGDETPAANHVAGMTWFPTATRATEPRGIRAWPTHRTDRFLAVSH